MIYSNFGNFGGLSDENINWLLSREISCSEICNEWETVECKIKIKFVLLLLLFRRNTVLVFGTDKSTRGEDIMMKISLSAVSHEINLRIQGQDNIIHGKQSMQNYKHFSQYTQNSFMFTLLCTINDINSFRRL